MRKRPRQRELRVIFSTTVDSCFNRFSFRRIYSPHLLDDGRYIYKRTTIKAGPRPPCMLYHFLGLFQPSLLSFFLPPILSLVYIFACIPFHSGRAGGERYYTTHEDGNKNVNIAPCGLAAGWNWGAFPFSLFLPTTKSRERTGEKTSRICRPDWCKVW